MMHEVLAKHYKLFMQRVKEHQDQTQPGLAPASRKHRDMRLAWSLDTVVAGHSVRYFKIHYCPDCLQGRVSGMTYHQEGDDARALGIINKSSNWSALCPAREERE